MAYQKKNLLEAFQASAAASKARATEGASKDVPRAAGPFARSSPAAPPAEEPELRPLDAAPRPRWQIDGVHRLIVLQVLIATAAFFLGRASVSTVDASTGDAGKDAKVAGVGERPLASEKSEKKTPAALPASSSGAQVSTTPGTDAERALLDPANVYTIKLVEYVKGSDDAIALDTLSWLEGKGLPAVAKFKGSRLFLLVGAAPTQKELDGLRDTVKSMNGPPPRDKPNEFHDAYVVKIDTLGIR
jgi:hypothetical protein